MVEAVPPPRDAGAAVLQSERTRLWGDPATADWLLNTVLARDPSHAGARLSQAAALIAEGGVTAALSVLEGPLPVDPWEAVLWQLHRAEALTLLGRSEEAQLALPAPAKVPAALSPLLEHRYLLLAVQAQDEWAIRRHADAMEQQLASTPDMPAGLRITAWFNLGRFWRAQRQPDRAFRAWTEGHRGLREFQPFSRAAYTAFMTGSMAAFPAARLHDGPRAGGSDPAPVFIVGMPRSATTLCEQILAAHPAVFGAGERFALQDTFTRLARSPETPETPEAVQRVAALDAAALDAAARDYLAELHALAPDKAIVVDKMPGNFRLLGFAALLLPGARIIHCVRDPRDTGLSIFQQRFTGNHAYAHDLADLGWYIAQERHLMAHWKRVLPNPVLTVHHTDWVQDFTGTLARVLEFLGLPYDEACEQFYALERDVGSVSRWQVRRPVNSQGIGRWREYAAHLAPMIAELEQAGVLP